MWSDNETNTDCIDYTHLIGAITGIIENPNLLPCSIGVFGDWGSGKSSLMRMVEEVYATQENVLVIRFNGWLFEGYEDAKTVLMGRIIDEIISHRTLSEKAKKAVIKLLKRIDVMKAAGSLLKYGISYAAMGPAGLAAMASVDSLAKLKDVDYEKYLKDKEEGNDASDSLRSSIQDFHDNFDTLIKETKLEKIIVFIDDLDRCSPDTVIGTLEAIKLFLFTQKTVFVIGADERLIKYAVRRRFPEIPGDNSEVGRDYLEKLIQYPIRIPPLNTIELINYINLLFSQLHIEEGEFGIARGLILKEKHTKGVDFIFDVNNADQFFHDINEDLKESFQLCSQVVPILAVGLNGNPRQCKRFLNSLLIRYAMARAKGISLNKRILAKLMLLEYFRPETFQSFHQAQMENSGLLPQIELIESMAQGKSKEGEKEEGAKLSQEQEAYLQDAWMKSWFSSSPSLKGENLQPYYYVSRDRLTVGGHNLQRMSPKAQEFFRNLISDAESVATNSIKSAGSLSEGDASAIFEVLAQKIREMGKQPPEKSLLKRLFEFTRQRIEMLSQLMVFLDKFPESDLNPGVVPILQDIAKDTPFKNNAKTLVKKWSQSKQNTTLSSISKSKLKDF